MSHSTENLAREKKNNAHRETAPREKSHNGTLRQRACPLLRGVLAHKRSAPLAPSNRPGQTLSNSAQKLILVSPRSLALAQKKRKSAKINKLSASTESCE